MKVLRRLKLLVSASVAVGVLGLAFAPGCRDATQVTLEISLAKRASCMETNGTAITVGTDPRPTEDRVRDEFVTATTTSCTETTRQIGTLVMTPGGSGRGSVVVVVAYDRSIVPSSCKPPLYKGCIVARRQFTFSEYQQLHLPITIDPECKDVPCDAFSTCRTGKCFSSASPADGDTISEPGDPGDGGTSVDGQVIPDTGVDSSLSPKDGGEDTSVPTDAPSDSPLGTDATDGAPTEGGPPPTEAYCDIDGNLQCPTPTTCNGGVGACCGPIAGGAATCAPAASTCSAGLVQYCCTLAPCGGMKLCLAAAPMPSPAFGASQNLVLPLGATFAGKCQ